MAHPRLHALLSKVEIEDYPALFAQIVHELINHSVFLIGEESYRFREVEFYIKDDRHPDPFTHVQGDQKSPGRFYFHKRGKTFQEGSIKGLDITCGNSTRYGGILIRGIQNVNTGEYIDGPGNVVQKILTVFQKTKVRDFAEARPSSVYEGKISIRPHADAAESQILWTPRVGLSLKKHMQDRIHYIVKEYRALALPIQTKKGLNWIHAALLLNHHPPLVGSRSSTVGGIARLLSQGAAVSSTGELALSKESRLNDVMKLYGFFKRPQ